MLHVGMNFAHGFLGADVLSNTHLLLIHVSFVIILWGSFALRVTIVFMPFNGEKNLMGSHAFFQRSGNHL